MPPPQERGAHCYRLTASKCRSRIYLHVSFEQAAKITALQAAYRRKEAETPKDDNAPTAGQIRTLGLLDRTDEEVNIFPAKFIPKVEHNNGPRKDERR